MIISTYTISIEWFDTARVAMIVLRISSPLIISIEQWLTSPSTNGDLMDISSRQDMKLMPCPVPIKQPRNHGMHVGV